MIQTRPNINPTDRLSVAQAAAALGVSAKTVMRKYKAGLIKIIPVAYNKDCRTVFSGATILKYWETH